jgi:hypothetical protein
MDYNESQKLLDSLSNVRFRASAIAKLQKTAEENGYATISAYFEGEAIKREAIKLATIKREAIKLATVFTSDLHADKSEPTKQGVRVRAGNPRKSDGGKGHIMSFLMVPSGLKHLYERACQADLDGYSRNGLVQFDLHRYQDGQGFGPGNLGVHRDGAKKPKEEKEPNDLLTTNF